MIVIAFLALGLTVIIHAIWLRHAAISQEMQQAQLAAEQQRTLKKLKWLELQLTQDQHQVDAMRQEGQAKAQTAVDKNTPRRP
jgi:hypothetical protein